MSETKRTSHIPKSHTVRAMKGGTVKFENYTRGLAIKLMCTECLGWGDSPRDCTSPLCPLFPFRGKTERSRQSCA